MSNYRLDLAQWKLAFTLTIVVFPFALLIFAVSGFDLRHRSDKHACRDGAADRCLAVGQFYEARTDGLVATLLSNAVTAKSYYESACKLGNRAGCARFGHMIVVGSYDAIRDSGYTLQDGMAALGKACDGGETSACHELADAAEPAQAAPVLAKLCESGDKVGCDKLVHTYMEIDHPRAVALLSKFCDAGNDDSCRELGRAFLEGSNYVDADPPRGAALLAKACDRGAWGGCRELGEAYLDGKLPPDPERTDALLTRGCEHGDPDACFDEGKSLVGRDPRHALQLFTTECNRGSVLGCDALGDLYRVGASGIARDRDHARSIYDHACRGGDDYECYKRDCYDANHDACYKVWTRQKKRYYRLGGQFDMR